MRLLLTSSNCGTDFAHLEKPVRVALNGARSICVILAPPTDLCVSRVLTSFTEWGVQADVLGDKSDPKRAVMRAQAFCVIGKGCTLSENGSAEGDEAEPLFRIIRERVRGGVPYVGIGAGAAFAGPVVPLDADMRVLGLGFTSFVVVPNYHGEEMAYTGKLPLPLRRVAWHRVAKDADGWKPAWIRRTLDQVRAPIVGIRQGSWLRSFEGEVRVEGPTGGRLFVPGQRPRECPRGDLSRFLG